MHFFPISLLIFDTCMLYFSLFIFILQATSIICFSLKKMNCIKRVLSFKKILKNTKRTKYVLLFLFTANVLFIFNWYLSASVLNKYKFFYILKKNQVFSYDYSKDKNLKCLSDGFNETEADIVAIKYYLRSLDYVKNIYGFCENKKNELRLVSVKDVYLYEKNGQINKELLEKLKKQKNKIKEDKNEEYFQVKLDFDYFKKNFARPSDIRCTLNLYDKVYRIHESRSQINISDTKEFSQVNNYELYVNKDGFYFVDCKANNNMTSIFYEDLIILPQKMKKLSEDREQYKVKETEFGSSHANDFHSTTTVLIKRSPIESKRKMNVIFLKIDSISKLHFKRTFPMTNQYLTKQMNNNIFYENLNSVGQNSYPNMIPILTGIIVDPLTEYDYNGEIDNYRDVNGFFDHLPFIWNQYENEGYITMYQEDMPSICQFNYNKPGFRFKPTGFYSRPYWVEHYRRRKLRCLNGIPTYTRYFDNIESFVERMNEPKNKDTPYVLFSFSSDSTHDDFAVPPNLDLRLKTMLNKFETKGYLNNTLLFLFSDHGNI